MTDAAETITIRVDLVTARLLRDVLYAQGEHEAAGAPIPRLNTEDSELLGAFLRALDVQLGGSGRMS